MNNAKIATDIESESDAATDVDDPFALLPFEILLVVVRHLASAVAVCRLAAVSRAVRIVRDDPWLWRTAYSALPFVHPEAEPKTYGHDWRWLCRARETPAVPRGQCVGAAAYREGRVVYHGEVLDGLPHGYGIMVVGQGPDTHRATLVRTQRSLMLGGNARAYEPGAWFEGLWDQGLLTDGRCSYSYPQRGARIREGFDGRLRRTLSGFDLVYERDGVYRYPDGKHYMGTMRAGERHGRGILVWPDKGWHYDGEWRDSNRHGRGTMTLTGGQRYDGEWRKDNKHGHGIYVYRNGSRYEGEWENDVRHGHGVMKYTNGNHYEGHWRLGQRHGDATYRFANGTRHEGVWVDGKQHGHGVEFDARGFTFEGNYADNERCGHGVISFASGERYDGEWKGDDYHGYGVWTDVDGTRYEGEWKDDNKDGRGTMVYADGVRYDGQWKSNRYHGRGVWTDADGNRYEGQWKEGLRDGYGDMTYANGDLYRGEWVEADAAATASCCAPPPPPPPPPTVTAAAATACATTAIGKRAICAHRPSNRATDLARLVRSQSIPHGPPLWCLSSVRVRDGRRLDFFCPPSWSCWPTRGVIVGNNGRSIWFSFFFFFLQLFSFRPLPCFFFQISVPDEGLFWSCALAFFSTDNRQNKEGKQSKNKKKRDTRSLTHALRLFSAIPTTRSAMASYRSGLFKATHLCRWRSSLGCVRVSFNSLRSFSAWPPAVGGNGKKTTVVSKKRKHSRHRPPFVPIDVQGTPVRFQSPFFFSFPICYHWRGAISLLLFWKEKRIRNGRRGRQRMGRVCTSP